MTQEPDSASVSVTYVVKNQDVVLNGTVSSGLLNQLTAELVGYFLFYPPLIIAERESDGRAGVAVGAVTLEMLWLKGGGAGSHPTTFPISALLFSALEYHNLDTSVATRIYWVTTGRLPPPPRPTTSSNSAHLGCCCASLTHFFMDSSVLLSCPPFAVQRPKFALHFTYFASCLKCTRCSFDLVLLKSVNLSQLTSINLRSSLALLLYISPGFSHHLCPSNHLLVCLPSRMSRDPQTHIPLISSGLCVFQ